MLLTGIGTVKTHYLVCAFQNSWIRERPVPTKKIPLQVQWEAQKEMDVVRLWKASWKVPGGLQDAWPPPPRTCRRSQTSAGNALAWSHVGASSAAPPPLTGRKWRARLLSTRAARPTPLPRSRRTASPSGWWGMEPVGGGGGGGGDRSELFFQDLLFSKLYFLGKAKQGCANSGL